MGPVLGVFLAITVGTCVLFGIIVGSTWAFEKATRPGASFLASAALTTLMVWIIIVGMLLGILAVGAIVMSI
jgi:hypothetical protein